MPADSSRRAAPRAFAFAVDAARIESLSIGGLAITFAPCDALPAGSALLIGIPAGGLIGIAPAAGSPPIAGYVDAMQLRSLIARKKVCLIRALANESPATS